MGLDDRSRRVLIGLVDRIELDAYVEAVERAIGTMPEYERFVGGDLSRADRGPAGILLHVETFLGWATSEGEVTDVERDRLRALVGARAVEGRPPEEGLAVYRRGMRAAWDVLLGFADDSERAVLGAAFDVMLEWFEVISQVFDEIYALERVLPQHERRSRWLLDRIAAGVGGGDVERVAAALGFALAPAYRPLAAALADGSPAEHAQLAGLLRSGGALVVADGTGVSGLTTGAPDVGRLGFASRLALSVGDPAPGPETEPLLADLASVVRFALAAGRRGTIAPDAFAVELLLARSPRTAAALYARVFAPLNDELAATVRALAEHGFERAAAATSLPVHRNTLLQRAARIEQLTGLDLDDPEDRLTIMLAVRAAQVGAADPGALP